MAKRTPSRRSARPARDRPAVSDRDLATAERDSLLQLRLGRTAHWLTVGVSALLVLDAVLLLFFFPTTPSPGSTDRGAAVLLATPHLLLPLVAALLLAGLGLAVKWGDFRFWPWERHVSVSVVALSLAVLDAILYAARVNGSGWVTGPLLFPGLLALALAAITTALLGLLLTWTPWDGRHWTSAGCAALPLASLLLIYVPAGTVRGGSEPLAVALLISAVLYQTSGSVLHLLASGSPAHRQALVLSGRTEIGRRADEVGDREDAVRFREAALLRRESEVETLASSVERAQQSAIETGRQLEATDGELRTRATAVAERERDVAGRAADLDGRARVLEDREKALALRTEQFGRESSELESRAGQLTNRETEVGRREVALTERQGTLDRRTAETSGRESRLAGREKQVEEKTVELLRREGDIAAKERAISAGGARGPAPGPSAGEQDLAAREMRVRHLKSLLDEQKVLLDQRAQEVAQLGHTNEAEAERLAGRQAAVVARESTLAHQESDVQRRLKAAEERRVQYDGSLADYRTRLDQVTRQQADLARRSVEVDQSLRRLPAREQSLLDREAKLSAAASDLDRRESALRLRENEADAREAEIGLGAARNAAGAPAPDGNPPEPETDLAPGHRSPSSVPLALRPSRTGPDTLAPVSGRRYADRLPSGTPRLDDLLLGGLPPKSHIAVVGDAFVGKEVVLYAFLAEGLRRSEPVVLVTATRSATEVADSLGLVLPQFREFEQQGLVTWIEAGGPGVSAGPHHAIVEGPADHVGILSAMAKTARELGDSTSPRFRVGFLGLSAILSQGDERAGATFLQNFVGILKPKNALAMYSLEAGAVSEAQVESVLGRMDGAIVFRQDRDRTFLSVKGFGDAETREWVECRATSRALVIGSFALERIR